MQKSSKCMSLCFLSKKKTSIFDISESAVQLVLTVTTGNAKQLLPAGKTDEKQLESVQLKVCSECRLTKWE